MIVVVGVGTLGVRVVKHLPRNEPVTLIDYDVITSRNVPSQYPQHTISKRKVDVCRDLFCKQAAAVHKHIDATTVGLLHNASIVIDCTDNLLSRRVISDYCAKHGIPWIHSALSDTAGAVGVFLPGGPCFSCLYPKGIGETCTDNLDITVADKVASVVALELQKWQQQEATSKFIRVSPDHHTVFSLSFRKDCLTCKGTYEWLEPRKFYITYCTGSKCMAAKPVKANHDHGTPRQAIVQGVPVQLFPNGEIHFLAETDDDVLYDIATQVFNAKTL